jgi:hypothetical protein
MNTPLDPGLELFTFAPAAAVTGTGYMPDFFPLGDISQISFATGRLFDVSSWTSWTLFGQVLSAGNVLELHIDFWDSPARHALVRHTVSLPNALWPSSIDPFMVVGRVAGPVMTVQLSATAPGFDGWLGLYLNNRPRHYDAPYTPNYAGQILAAVGLQNITNGAGGDITVELPYYLGPAILNAHFVGAPASCHAQVSDNSAQTIYLADVQTDGPGAHLWIPNPFPFGAPWELVVANRSGATQQIAATLVAAP